MRPPLDLKALTVEGKLYHGGKLLSEDFSTHLDSAGTNLAFDISISADEFDRDKPYSIPEGKYDLVTTLNDEGKKVLAQNRGLLTRGQLSRTFEPAEPGGDPRYLSAKEAVRATSESSAHHLGLTAEEALASTMMRAEGMSAGRDIGVVINRPNRNGPCLLPACGGVGTQYTPATGWAQSLVYRARVLGDESASGCNAVAHGGDASTATNGFWASLNVATTGRLPLLYFIEDNGYGISVPTSRQTPGGDVAANLASFRNLRILCGDGSESEAAAALIEAAVTAVRSGEGPVFLRLTVPRLSGHSGQDTQAYKSAEEIAAEQARDPLLKLRQRLVPALCAEAEWQALEDEAGQAALAALAAVESRPQVFPGTVTRHARRDHHGRRSADQPGG